MVVQLWSTLETTEWYTFGSNVTQYAGTVLEKCPNCLLGPRLAASL